MTEEPTVVCERCGNEWDGYSQCDCNIRMGKRENGLIGYQPTLCTLCREMHYTKDESLECFSQWLRHYSRRSEPGVERCMKSKYGHGIDYEIKTAKDNKGEIYEYFHCLHCGKDWDGNKQCRCNVN